MNTVKAVTAGWARTYPPTPAVSHSGNLVGANRRRPNRDFGRRTTGIIDAADAAAARLTARAIAARLAAS